MRIGIQVIDPAGKVIADISGTGQKSAKNEYGPSEMTGVIDMSAGLELNISGTYKMRLSCEGTLIAENKFTVIEKGKK